MTLCLVGSLQNINPAVPLIIIIHTNNQSRSSDDHNTMITIPYLTALTTYFSYGLLFAFGQLRDFFRKLIDWRHASNLQVFTIYLYTHVFFFIIFLVLHVLWSDHNFVFLGLCADLLRAWGFLYTEVVSTYPGTTLFCPWTLLERLIMWTILGKAKYANQYEKVALC